MDDGAPEVTAIIIVKDGEAFLGEAIDSVLGQVGAEPELVVVDDGSVDRTAEIVRNYERRYPGRVRLVSHPGGENRGMAASRNLGIAHARGRFIAFNDADDVWEPTKIAEQVALFEAHPEVGLIYGRVLIWHSWSPGSTVEDHFVPLGVEPDRVQPPLVLFELLMENRCQTPTPCCSMIRRTVFDRLGGFEPRFRAMFEDTTFFAKALATTPVYVSGRQWAKYRQHPQSATAVSARAGRDDRARVRFLFWLRRSIRDHSSDPRVLAAVDRALRETLSRVVRRPLWRIRRRLGLVR
jgi:glycosyltransferase involved in cell wall biosynthesis